MSRFLRLSVLAVAAAALVACGGDEEQQVGAKLGGGKQGAAQALFEASQPASQGGQGGLLQALVSGAAGVGTEVTVNCAKKGSVKLKLDLTSGNDTSGSLKYELEYNACNEDGANQFDGKLAMELKFAATETSAALELKLKGRIAISGEIEDYLDADVTETIDVMATGKDSGSVTVKLNGTIATSTESYVYNNESITITVGGELPAADGNS
ncbi:MAG TPA: hypothetical protein VF815_19540 [Myxococcaceae bacterium]